MNQKPTVRVLICTGHTGGHFFPAVSCAETFESEHPEVEVHILVNRISPLAEHLIKERSLRVHLIGFSSFPTFFSFKMIPFLLEYVAAFWKTLSLLLKIKPKLVIGFGSYGSIPGILCAAFYRIPILLHEQNALAGRANQFLALWADRIAVSFPETRASFAQEKVFWSGYPLRSSFWGGINQFPNEQLPSRSFTILVFGGSQGARRLNQVFLKSLEALKAEERTDLAVIHIVGNNDTQGIKETYQKLGIEADVSNFSYRISEQYKRADLVIARAGAGTIFELAALRRAAILIPYPHAYAHQKANAEYLVRRGSAQAIEDGELTDVVLRDTIIQLKNNVRQREELGENIQRLAKREAGQLLTGAGWELICEKNSYV